MAAVVGMLASVAALWSADGGIGAIKGDQSEGEVPGRWSLVAGLEAGFAPIALSEGKRVPVRFDLGFDLETLDGSWVTPTEEIILRLDRDIAIGVRGMPVCRGEAVREAADIEELCRDAVVGRGRTNFEIRFPEQGVPITTAGKVTVFNGGGSGATKLYAVGSVTIPRPAPVVMPIEVTHTPGRYGTRMAITVPKVAGGFGDLFELDLSFFRSRAPSLVTARCGRGVLPMRIEVGLVEDLRYETELQPGCRPRR